MNKPDVFMGVLIRGAYLGKQGGVFLIPSEITLDSMENAKQTISGVLNTPVDVLKFRVLPFSASEYPLVH